MNSKFSVVGRLDSASRVQAGTVIISRTSGTFTVRPYRRRRTYVLPLSTVAEIVCQKILRSELAERTAAKRESKRKGRSV
jgi:hypothetical protein